MGRKAPTGPAFTIREAIEEDLPLLVEFLARLTQHVAGAPPLELRDEERARLTQVLRSALEDPDKLLAVAETPDAGPVGMGYIYVWRSQGIWEQAEPVEYRSGVIDDVWVEPNYRKLGIFRALALELVGFAESRNAYDLIVEYSASNEEAQAVWTRLGFRTTGVRAAALTSAVRQSLSF